MSSNAVGVWAKICPICRWWGTDHKLQSVEIISYKNLKNVTIDLRRVNVFIGEPGVGKSALLETFALWQLFIARQTLSDDLVLKIKRWGELDGTRMIYRDTDNSVELRISDVGKYYLVQYGNDPVAFLPRDKLSILWVGGDEELLRPRLAYYKFGEPSIQLYKLDYVVPPFGYNMDYLLKLHRWLGDMAKNYGYKGNYEALPEPVRRYLFYLAISETSRGASIAIDDMTCHYQPLSKIVAEHISRDAENQYLVSTYDETVLISLIEKAPANDLNVYVVGKDGLKRADPEKVLDLAGDVFFNLDHITGDG
jgi:hypothetical protein